MGRKPHLPWRIAVEQYACETCGAPPGKPCVTTSDNPKGEPHAWRARMAAAYNWNADLLAELEQQERDSDGEQ
jgi:hypothetical protein